ncbi:MAG: hypothetical protein RBT64_03005 [Trichloromonas sp.]|jgi:uncharacterized iron-regulated protein|nr:hypothetical protein [Trichloromonas sp.]
MLLFTHILKLSLFLLILIPEWSHAEEKYKEVSRALLPLFDRSDILIIGESHGKDESTRLLAELAGEATQGRGCLTVALEIGSEQQEVVDAAMTGKANVAEIGVAPAIDHAGYREMLAAFSRLTVAGSCLKVVAIDGEPEIIERDAWMAEKLAPYLGKGRVVALLGALHTAKDIRWDNGRGKAFLAERLVAKGVRVCSVVQIWGGQGSDKIAPLAA